MGIVVPYDKRTEVGYRSLDPSGESLRKLLYRQVSAKPEARAAPQSELDELVNWANIANDECDFGASLQLGSDLFNHSPQLAALTGRVLQTAYTLLGRDEYASIAAEHAASRSS
uniref:Uncharacterized protein n=1 Tax=Haptolina ericina TaxID=156174 RepID=A0A7S3AWL4_9EUKA